MLHAHTYITSVQIINAENRVVMTAGTKHASYSRVTIAYQ